MNELLNKGQKKVAAYMKKANYRLYDCVETESGYEAEYYKTAAGITISKIVITFSKNGRVTKVA